METCSSNENHHFQSRKCQRMSLEMAAKNQLTSIIGNNIDSTLSRTTIIAGNSAGTSMQIHVDQSIHFHLDISSKIWNESIAFYLKHAPIRFF